MKPVLQQYATSAAVTKLQADGGDQKAVRSERIAGAYDAQGNNRRLPSFIKLGKLIKKVAELASHRHYPQRDRAMLIIEYWK
jgi:hypothetical protein